MAQREWLQTPRLLLGSAKMKDYLELSTKKSIHEQLKVKVDGKVFQGNPLSRALFKEVKKYEKKALAGDINALYKQVTLIFDIPEKTLDKLDVRDINSILNHAMAKIFSVSEEETDKEKIEKNGLSPGANKSA